MTKRWSKRLQTLRRLRIMSLRVSTKINRLISNEIEFRQRKSSEWRTQQDQLIRPSCKLHPALSRWRKQLILMVDYITWNKRRCWKQSSHKILFNRRYIFLSLRPIPSTTSQFPRSEPSSIYKIVPWAHRLANNQRRDSWLLCEEFCGSKISLRYWLTSVYSETASRSRHVRSRGGGHATMCSAYAGCASRFRVLSGLVVFGDLAVAAALLAVFVSTLPKSSWDAVENSSLGPHHLRKNSCAKLLSHSLKSAMVFDIVSSLLCLLEDLR